LQAALREGGLAGREGDQPCRHRGLQRIVSSRSWRTRVVFVLEIEILKDFLNPGVIHEFFSLPFFLKRARIVLISPGSRGDSYPQ
jgi:hypothetical protein